ncbi:tail fiber assembly protein [Escherichia coli]
MNLEALPKYYSPKSPKLSDDAPATGSGGLTITDVMAAQGMVQSKAPLGFALFLAKVGVLDEKEGIALPDIPAGFVAVFNSNEASWHLVEDHRGKTVYDVASGDALFISELGPLPENVTWLSPGGEYQKWNGTAWVKDTEAEKLFRIREAEETKNSLMQVASEHIAPLQDAVDLEIATEEEISLLEAWKKYRVLLNRVDTSTAPDIEWPIIPVTS